MSNQQTFEVRDLRDSDWYWIHKAVIQGYAQRVGAVGIVVYSFLASLADSNQSCFPSQKYIAQSLGYSRSYINETLKLLERNGLIRIEKRGRYHCIYHLLKVRCQPGRTRVSTIPNSDVNYTDTNNNKLTRNINDIPAYAGIMEGKNLLSKNSFKGFRPKSREELLALDLADALSDRKNLPLYLSYARRYPEPLLRRILSEVKEVPFEKIKRSRAALFSYLLKKYAKETVKSLGD
ncbi:MAG: helix-turn-helix domain-containing protein [Halobacteria archaeon]